MNRAVGKRALFESEREIRSFLALLALSVRQGWIEVHAFAVLPNHFHLLVRCPTGQLSKVMMWIQSKYVSAFNRLHDRDGPLVRGRFRSKRVRDENYRRLLVGYIDWNPVAAFLCATPESYHYGSARGFVRGRPRPWVSSWMVSDMLGGTIEPSRYRRLFHPTSSQIDICERRLELGDRVGPGGNRGFPRDREFSAWLRRRALLADGDTRRNEPVLGLHSARGAIDRLTSAELPTLANAQINVASTLLVGLLRSMSGMTFAEIATSIGVSTQAAHKRWGRHRSALESSDEYRAFFVELAAALVRRDGEGG